MKITTLSVRRNERYTTNMSFFVSATEAKHPKTKNSQVAAMILAAFLIIMVVGQLFTYEKFAEVIDAFDFFSDKEISMIVAALIVVFEVASLPFLLKMRLSPLARVVSMAAGWLVLLFWFGMSVWLNITFSLAPNSGVLGDTVHLPIGGWMVSFFGALILLDLWACDGLWPRKSLRKK
jgi:hypothetical protein